MIITVKLIEYDFDAKPMVRFKAGEGVNHQTPLFQLAKARSLIIICQKRRQRALSVPPLVGHQAKELENILNLNLCNPSNRNIISFPVQSNVSICPQITTAAANVGQK